MLSSARIDLLESSKTKSSESRLNPVEGQGDPESNFQPQPGQAKRRANHNGRKGPTGCAKVAAKLNGVQAVTSNSLLSRTKIRLASTNGAYSCIYYSSLNAKAGSVVYVLLQEIRAIEKEQRTDVI